MIDYKRPRRERSRAWKAIICLFRGHDWGMYWKNRPGQAGDYVDICVRCGKHKDGTPRPPRRRPDNVTDISHRLRVPPPSRL